MIFTTRNVAVGLRILRVFRSNITHETLMILKTNLTQHNKKYIDKNKKYQHEMNRSLVLK